MIIDLSYFRGLINVANLDKPATAEVVNAFIVQYEPEYLQKILGYQLATDFMTGLQQSSIDQKWLDLLLGATYSYGGQTHRWNGFAASYTYPNPNTAETTFNWVVGAAGSPVVGSKKFIEKRFIGKLFTIERNGYGTMVRLADDGSNTGIADYRYYASFDPTTGNVAGTVELLKDGVTFQPNELYTNHITGYVGAINLSTVNISPIAYYVFFYMTRDLVQQQTGLGVQVVQTAENAIVVPPISSQVTVWNRMVELNRSLYAFLSVNSTVYGWSASVYTIGSNTWRGYDGRRVLLTPINSLNV